ncbi:MAG TPA: hypothetical protein VH914_22085 [Acidimicrobiia bacterium]|jgi:hypothetical protein|nr:hypothetical protein [Acidimicrobiia bacterium]
MTALVGFALLAAPTAGQAAPQQTGNIPLNGTAQPVSITTPGETATFRFPGTTGEAVSALLSSSTFTGCPALTLALIRPDASQLTSVNTCTSSAFLDQTTLDQNGTWSLRVTPASNGTGTASLAAYPSADQVKPVNVSGAAVNVVIKWPGQNAGFTFAGTTGQEISAQTSSSTLTGCATYTLVRPDGTTLKSGQPACNASDFFDAQTLDRTGTWTVRLDPQGTATGNATLNVYDATDQTKAITLNGSAVNVTINKPGQNASLTFSGTSGQGVSAQVGSATFAGCPAFTAYLLRPNGTQLGSPASSCNASLFLSTQTLDATGTWTLVIDPVGTTTGTAQVQAFESADQVVALTLNGAPTNVILGPGQTGSYTFTGAVGQQISAQVSNSTFSGCTAYTLSLLRPNGTQFGPSVNGCGATAFFDSVTLDQAGTWAFVFAPQSDSGGSASLQAYTFSDQSQPTFDMDGKNNKLVIGRPGQNAITTFSGNNGQHIAAYTLRSTLGGCPSFTVSLVRPNGTTLTTLSTCTDNAFLDQTTLDASGTWKVLFDPQGPVTGTAVLQLYTVVDVHPTIKPGGPIKSFTTTTRGLNGHFKFTGKVGDVRTVTITGSTFGGCPGLVVSFVRPNGTVLASQSTCNKTLTLGPSTLDAAGSWEILVDPQGPANGTLIIKVT